MKHQIIIFLSILAFVSSFLLLVESPKRRLAKPDNPGEAMRWFYEQRAYPLQTIPLDWKQRAFDHIQAHNIHKINSLAKASTAAPLTWSAVGPNNIGGRTRSIAVSPSNSNIIYAGSVSGGVWKSTNAGSSWSPTNDFADNLAITALAINPTDANIIYASTGEGFFNGGAVRGAGVLKSTDAGSTWTLQTSFSGFSTPPGFPYFINDLYLRPDSVNILYAATNSGLFRTTNSGVSWVKIHQGTTARATQIVGNPSTPWTFYVCYGNFSTDGIYKTTNGGTNFTKLTTGLPTSGYYRISLGIGTSNPSVLYASYCDASTFGTLGVYKTTNGGTLWFSVTTPVDPLPKTGGTHLGGQEWYNNVITVDPTNENTVYAGGINLFKTTDGGSNWTMISNWYTGVGYPYVHADQHAIVFSGSTIYFGSDGGIFRSTNVGTSFTEMNNGFATVQFYSGAAHPSAEIYYGGTQDNGTLKSNTIPNWSIVFGGDGGHTAVNYTTPTTVYTEYVYLCLQKSTNAGLPDSWTRSISGIPTSGPEQVDGTSDRCLFIAPFTMDPSDPQRIVAGTYCVYYTTNGAGSWTAISSDLTGDGSGSIGDPGSTISAIAIARTSSSTIYIGTSGSGSSASRVQVTTNTGASWTNVTSSPLPNRYVTFIAIDPTDANRALVCYSGYNTNTSSTPGHLFLTTNRGGSWVNVSGNLPDIPVNVSIIDPEDRQHIIVGTDLGVFETANGGANWTQQNSGMANVVVTDLDLRGDRSMLAATHGRGMFKAELGILNAVDTVYPGDANVDGVVDVRDILPIARFFGLSGPARPNASSNWGSQYLTTLWSPPEAADADCDGNGTVQTADVQVLITNWYRTRDGAFSGTNNPIVAVEEILNSLGTNPSSPALKAIRAEVVRYRSELLGIAPSWKLEQNFPNPFNPQTTIRYTVPVEVSTLTVRIVDITGRLVREHRLQDVLPGNYSYTWDGMDNRGTSVASGIYWYVLTAGDVRITQKMILAK